MPGKWLEIPCIVYDNLEPEAIDAIRLQAHLVGPRQWDAYSKAKYLHFLYEHENMPLSRLVEYCGGRRREVSDYIAAYSDMEDSYRKILDSDGDFDTTRFSGFVELQKPRIKQSIIGAGFNVDDFSNWINDSLIDPLNTVRSLPRILSDPDAKDTFLREGAKEALKIIESSTDSGTIDNASITMLCHALKRKLQGITFNDTLKLKEIPSSERTQALLDTYDEIKTIIDFINETEDD